MSADNQALLSGAIRFLQQLLKEASTEIRKIVRWGEQWPNANVGIVTGAESDIIVLDSDSSDALWELESKNAKLPETLTACTGKGVHVYFKYPGRHVFNSVGKIGDKLDIRGDRGYVVAPPSLHVSGSQYRWTSAQGTALAPCPLWLINAIAEPKKSSTPRPTGSTIANGTRNDTLFSMACAMRSWGATTEAVTAALKIDNEARCDPPLDTDEVLSIVGSAMRYEQSAPGANKDSRGLRAHKLRSWRTARG